MEPNKKTKILLFNSPAPSILLTLYT